MVKALAQTSAPWFDPILLDPILQFLLCPAQVPAKWPLLGAHCPAECNIPRLFNCNSAVCRTKLTNYAPNNLATSPLVSNPWVSDLAAKSYRRQKILCTLWIPQIFFPGWQWSRSPLGLQIGARIPSRLSVTLTTHLLLLEAFPLQLFPGPCYKYPPAAICPCGRVLLFHACCLGYTITVLHPF